MSFDPIVIRANQSVTRLTPQSAPAATVRAGEIVQFETSDRSYTGMTGEAIDRDLVDFREVNLMTGPVFVNDTHPGDALGFEIMAIDVITDAHVPYVARWRSESFGLRRSEVHHFRLERDVVRISDAVRLPIRPTIGCLATAPSKGVLSSLSPCRSTGGNLDIADFCPGTTVWLPVRVVGAMFALGDLHASMGRGEPVGCGLECGGIVTGSFHVRPNASIPGVRFSSGHSIGFVGSDASDIMIGRRKAINAAWHWLTVDCEVGQRDALAISAAMLHLTLGGPAGANCVASFDLEALRKCGVEPPVAPRSRPCHESPETVISDTESSC